jgi:hypothetical protein
MKGENRIGACLFWADYTFKRLLSAQKKTFVEGITPQSKAKTLQRVTTLAL